MLHSKFIISTIGKIGFNFHPKDECQVIIPNPSGKASAVIILRREQIFQYVNDLPDVVEFCYGLKLTEENMLEIQRQWAENDKHAQDD